MKIYRKERQPDYLIIGAQRCGTTSLYSYLAQHPQIVPAEKKEVHFFDLNFHQGVDWYREKFPNIAKCVSQETATATREAGNKYISGFISGEASPYYLFHPFVPQRVHQLFPEIKLIVLLRNPVERTISHYYHEVRLGWESLSFEDAIAQEDFRLKGESEKMFSNERYYSFNHQHYTYLSRGIYINQIATWMSLFPKEQFLIIKSEDFYTQPDLIFNEACEFLNLPSFQIPKYEKINAGDYLPVSETMQSQLKEYFQPYNQKLEEFLGRKFDW